MLETEWLGLVDDLRRITIFELPGFPSRLGRAETDVCELRRGIPLSCYRKAKLGVAPVGAETDGCLIQTLL